jgi:hypothetical protein
MKLRLQFAGWMLTPLLAAALALPCVAQQRPHADEHPQKPARAPRQEQRQAERQSERRAQRQAQKPVERQRPQNDRPPNARTYTPLPPPRNMQATRPPRTEAGSSVNGANRPPIRNQEEQRRLEQNKKRFNQLPPPQQQELRERAQVWQRMTPGQREHIKNEVLPKWKELPPDRRKAIQHRLGVLQNMPESARNQHLNDPNFTRGMSEEDKSTLRDLSHLHVGGAPEPPGE